MFKNLRLLGALICGLSVLSSNAHSRTCAYYLDYIKGEAERPYALKKVYQYTPERLEKILALRDQGKNLCDSGNSSGGIEVLLESVKLINFTRLK